MRFDTDQSGYLSDQELKYGVNSELFLFLKSFHHFALPPQLEKMGVAQTHMQLRGLMKEIDLDQDGKVSYVEFLNIFKLAKEGKLMSEGLKKIAAEVKVEEVGVGGVCRVIFLLLLINTCIVLAFYNRLN